MIRHATTDDLVDVAVILREFNERITGQHLPLPEYGETLEKFFDAGNVLLVSDTESGIKGIIAGQVLSNPFFGTSQFLQEVAWYATDNSGMRLLQAFIKEAKDRELDSVYLTVLETAGERVHDLLKRIGFNAVERSYMMKL
jgi:N-acetylglutamate synthase-like GNAT family acetyltransferase